MLAAGSGCEVGAQSVSSVTVNCLAEPGPGAGRDRERHSAYLPDTSRCQGLGGGAPPRGAVDQDPAIRLLFPFCGK